jgi:dTDP-D-glucose 4,6-dehydratase
MNKKFLVTGGAEFIGSGVICCILNGANHSVVNVDKLICTGNPESL